VHCHKKYTQISPKKEGEGKKSEIKKIINLSYPNATPYGWAFDGFFDVKEYLKDLSNRDSMVTIIGNLEYRPFSNLTTKWLKDSEFRRLIWVIGIDIELDGTDHCFPMEAHLAYANKLHEASFTKIFGKKVRLRLLRQH
jgi:hypothetical protein